MYFSNFTEKMIYLQSSVNPPTVIGMFNGLMLNRATNSINPAIFPNPELIWYIEHLKRGEEINWLISTGESNRKFAEIDLSQLKLAVNRFLQKHPIDYDTGHQLPLFSKYRDCYESMYEGEYNEYLSTFEWHKKRINLFTQKNFCCEKCDIEGTVNFYNGIHESQRLHFTITRFSSAHTEEIKKAIKYFRSFNLRNVTAF